MALLNFPINPVNGQIYPSAPVVGENVYEWQTAYQTWILQGKVTGVNPGTYGNALQVARFTVDWAGKISFAEDVPIQLGTTSQIGLVQLTDNTTSDDDTTALTAAQGYYLQTQIGNLALLSPPSVDLVTAINAAYAKTADLVLLNPAINGNTTVQGALEDAVYDIASAGNTVTISSSPTGLFNIEVTQATETQLGGAEIATQTEVDAGTDDTRIVTPLKLATYVSGGNIDSTEIPLSPPINGNLNVQSALEDAVYDVASAGNTVTVSSSPTGLFNIEVTQATENQLGGAEIATQAEADAGTNDTLIITPLKLATYVGGGNIDSTEIPLAPPINGNLNVQSALEDAVYDISSAGNSNTITSDPTGLYNIEVTQATEDQLGGAEVATQAETDAGTDDTRFVTPLKLTTFASTGGVSAPFVPLSPSINGNTNVQDALEDAVYDIASPGNTLTVSSSPTGLFDVEVTQATETQLGGAEVATQVETDAGTDDTRFITPLKLTTFANTGGVSAPFVPLSPSINGNTNVQDALEDAIYDVESSNLTITVSESSVGQVDITLPPVGAIGSYSYASITVDQEGRVTAASTNTSPNTTVVSPITNTGTSVEPIIGVLPSSTTQSGVVQLNNTLTSGATDQALTAAMGQNLQQQLSALAISGGLTNAGTFDASTGQMINVSVAGATAGFTVGADVPSPSSSLLDYFVQITVPGTYSPPGGGGPFTLVQGDWLFCNGTNWIQVEIGPRLPDATTTTKGAVELSTDAETQAGTNGTVAVTPVSLSSRSSTETRTGLAEIATQAEVDAGADDTRIVTPLKLSNFISGGGGGAPASSVVVNPAINGNNNVQSALEDAVYNIASAGSTLTVTSSPTGLFNLEVAQATEGRVGGAEIATQAEVNTGTDDTRFVTPLKLATYVSGGQVTAAEIPLSPTINGNSNVQSALQDAIYDVTSANSSLTVAIAATGLVTLTAQSASDTLAGVIELATNAETQAGTDAARAVTPAGLTSRTATETRTGIVELATTAEVQTGTDTTRAITPAGLTSRSATEGRTGIAEIATQAEVNAGTDDSRFVTPLKLATYISGGQINASEVPLSPTINGNTNVQSALQDAIYDVTSANSSLTVAIAATGLVTLTSQPASDTLAGVVELATAAETQAGTDSTRAVTPAGLASRTATETRTGIIELATAAEVQTGTDTARAVTPAGLSNRTATETRTGIAEIATQAEVNAGTDDTTIVTPLKLSTYITGGGGGVPASAVTVNPSINGSTNVQAALENAVYSVASSTLTVTEAATGNVTIEAPAQLYHYAQLDDISGSFNGSTTAFALGIGGVAYTPSPSGNLMVFIGGIAQIPGSTNAYTVSGSTITFTEAPRSGATFYATTVVNT